MYLGVFRINDLDQWSQWHRNESQAKHTRKVQLHCSNKPIKKPRFDSIIYVVRWTTHKQTALYEEWKPKDQTLPIQTSLLLFNISFPKLSSQGGKKEIQK